MHTSCHVESRDKYLIVNSIRSFNIVVHHKNVLSGLVFDSQVMNKNIRGRSTTDIVGVPDYLS